MSSHTLEQFQAALKGSLESDDDWPMWVEAVALTYRGDNKRETLDDCFESATLNLAFARFDESNFVLSDVLEDTEKNSYVLVTFMPGRPFEVTLHVCFVDGRFYVTYPFNDARYEHAYWELTADRMTGASGGD